MHTKIMGRKMAQKSKAYIYVLNTSWVKSILSKTNAVVRNRELAN